MKIKKPSLKGMKNTKYLGHFAQDKYMEKGHNLSGRFPMFREPSQLEMMEAANPFDATAELKRREQQVASEVAALGAQTPDNTAEMAQIQSRMDRINAQRTQSLRDVSQLKTQQQLMEQAKSRSRAGREQAYRANRKKFLTEV
jgi:chromosome segregation ATPase